MDGERESEVSWSDTRFHMVDNTTNYTETISYMLCGGET